MGVELEIRDGDPWWVSPDIWTEPDIPVAGAPTTLKARVWNKGSDVATGVTVAFYWSFGGVVDISLATQVGFRTGVVVPASSGGADGQLEVSCPSPWIPAFGENGHVCLLVSVFSAQDPLPPGSGVDVIGDRHYAQRNVTVVTGDPQAFSALFVVHNANPKELEYDIQVEPGAFGDLSKETWEHLAIPVFLRDSGGRVTTAGIVEPDVTCPAPELRERADRGARVRVRPGHAGAVRVLAGVEGGAGVLHVTARIDGRDDPVGGVTYVVLPQEPDGVEDCGRPSRAT